MTNLVVAFRSFVKGSDTESKCWTDLSIRRDQPSCQPHVVSPRAKICHVCYRGLTERMSDLTFQCFSQALLPLPTLKTLVCR